MGVDNSGVLVVGDKLSRLDLSNFPLYDQMSEYESINDLYWGKNLIELKLHWTVEEPGGYEPSGLFGFCLESPSYGVSEFDYSDFIDDLLAIDKCWRAWTGKEPVVYLMNLQG